jgi:hypothetical protein
MSISNFKILNSVEMKEIMAGYGGGGGADCCDEKPCQGKGPGAICSKNGLSGNCNKTSCVCPNGSSYFYYDCN